MSCSLSSKGSPLGILEVKSGGMDSWELLLLVLLVELATFTLLAKLLGTRPGKDEGSGEGVGETGELCFKGPQVALNLRDST